MLFKIHLKNCSKSELKMIQKFQKSGWVSTLRSIYSSFHISLFHLSRTVRNLVTVHFLSLSLHCPLQCKVQRGCAMVLQWPVISGTISTPEKGTYHVSFTGKYMKIRSYLRDSTEEGEKPAQSQWAEVLFTSIKGKVHENFCLLKKKTKNNQACHSLNSANRRKGPTKSNFRN